MVRLLLVSIFSLLAIPSIAAAQSDPRFGEAIEASQNWDRDKAMSLTQSACDENIASACGRLLTMHVEDGENSKKRALSSKPCDADDAYACYLLGNLADWASGGAEDKPLARASYAKACKAGLPIACIQQAEMTMKGE